MPAISEEDEGCVDTLPTSFSELLELPETAFTGSDVILAGPAVAAEPMQPTCPAHPDTPKYARPPG